MKVPRFLALLAAFTSLFALHAGAQGTPVHPQTAPAGASTPHQPTPEQIAKMPVTALPIKDFKLLNSTTGWASTGGRLFLTTDSGTHWKDISPPNPNQDHYADVFFHDADAGWVLFAHRIRDDEEPAADSPTSNWTFHLSATVNGGATWTNENLPAWNSDRGMGDQGVIAFSDKLHGWLSLGIAGSTTWSASELLATSDGGRTWVSTKGGSEGRVEAMLALTGKDVWVVGSPEGGSELDVSHDGGDSFQEVALPAPKEFAQFGYPEYSLPTFTDSLNGYEAVTYSDSEASKSVAVMYATQDGGRTWKLDRILSNLAEGETVRSTVAGSTWVLPFAPVGSEPALVKLFPGGRTAAATHTSSGTFNLCGLSFLTPDEGWMNCSSGLSSTIDGGATWTAIAPRTRNGVLTTDPVTPLPPQKPLKTIPIKTSAVGTSGATAAAMAAGAGTGQSGIDQHLGFDISKYMPPAEMKKWWDSSPYYDAIFYAPGAPTHLPNGSTQFTAAWGAALLAQGWGFIPVWSGYQSDCACAPPTKTNKSTTWPSCPRFNAKTQQIDPEPAKATKQGTKEADDAITAFRNLGFDGLIVYLDVEGFNDTSTGVQVVNGKTYACSASAKAYMGGFVAEMHNEGALAGLYGSASDIKSDFLPEKPDEIYIADTSGKVTVWGMGAKSYKVSDLDWPNKQRIHQYMAETLQTWGGSRSYSVDLDIVDATIVPSSGVKKYTSDSFQAPVLMSNAYELFGINNAVNNGTALQMGTVLGYDFSENLFTYSPAAGMTMITSLLGATGINNLGQVIGYDQNDNNVLYTPGANPPTTPIYGPEGMQDMNLNSINDAGWILGEYSDQDGIQHCMLSKPPYNSNTTFSFDFIGDIPCDANQPVISGGSGTFLWGGNDQADWLGINGLGLIVGSAVSAVYDGYGNTTPLGSEVFFDDVENGVPGPSDNLAILATTQGWNTLLPVGVNNNGQVAGTYLAGEWFTCEGEGTEQGFFINTDGSYSSIVIFPADLCDYLTGINDDVQMAGTSDLGGFTIDTQH
ncbi:MAG TPA: glycoside hydrolase domain-containing protein [Terracidiphilus sp.]|nr:glycoside hydrolase domain-containing protein [Terracidiphilus sp.]